MWIKSNKIAAKFASSWVAKLRERLAQRPDTEHTQILIRSVIITAIAVYVYSVDHEPRALVTAGISLFIGVVVSPILFIWLLRHNEISRVRRGVAVFIDGVIIPGLCIGGGDTTLPFISFAIWLSIAHGFRYGPGYLQATLLLGSATVITAIWLDPIRQGHTGFVVTLALGLISLPLYFNRLLKKWQEANQLLQVAAKTDALTGLPNRAGLIKQFAEPIGSFDTVTILGIDLDGFKSVNDSCGHNVGDRLLLAVSDRIRALLGPRDHAFRLGGDEFAIIHISQCADCTQSSEALAQQLLAALRAPFQLGVAASAISASIGIAAGQPGVRASQHLLDEADQALYLAKRNGRNRVVWFSEALRTQMQREASIEQRLRIAIAEDKIELHFQPQIDAGTGEIVAVEALARWNDEELGIVSPTEFVAIAERSELISMMGFQLLHNACHTAAKWQGQAAQICVSVNISVLELLQDDFLSAVQECLDHSGLAPWRLELEVTETRVADRQIFAKLEALRAMGIHLAMDDFGAGATSLASLRHLPFDRLKLDKGLVDELANDKKARAVTTAVIDLARSLGQLVIAEGVETQAQAGLLTAQGCHRLQGYLFAKAMPEELLIKNHLSAQPAPMATIDSQTRPGSMASTALVLAD